MKINKSKTVSFIYCHTNNSPTLITFTPRLERQLDRSVADMIEDGFDTFIVSIEKSFGILAATAVLKAKKQNPEIKLLIFSYCDDSQWLGDTPTECEKLRVIRDNADNLLYSSSVYTHEVPTDLNDFPLYECHGVIFYYEIFTTQAMSILCRSHRDKKIVINLSIFV